MSIKKYKARGKTLWKIDMWIELSDGVKDRLRKRDIPTKEMAEEIVRKAIADAYEGRYLPQKSAQKRTVEMEYEDFISVKKGQKKSWKTDVGRAVHLLRLLGKKKVVTLTLADMDRYRQIRSTEKTRYGKTPTTATVNREIALLRSILNFSKSRRRIVVNPSSDVQMMPENNRRIRKFSAKEFMALFNHADGDLKPILLFACDTGMRKESILGLRWEHVSLQGDYGRVCLDEDDIKRNSGVPIVVLSKRTTEMLRKLPRSLSGYVFVNPRTGTRWNTIQKKFVRACEAAKIPHGLANIEEDGVIFHDLRRTFINTAGYSEVDDRVAMSMSGHKTMSAFERYRHVDDSEQLRAVKKMESTLEEIFGGSGLKALENSPHKLSGAK